jgi:hypothetical protein
MIDKLFLIYCIIPLQMRTVRFISGADSLFMALSGLASDLPDHSLGDDIALFL